MTNRYARFLFLLIACTLMIAVATSVVAKSTGRSAADQKLYDKARATCRPPAYPNGTHFIINYSGKWFRCVEPKRSR